MSGGEWKVNMKSVKPKIRSRMFKVMFIFCCFMLFSAGGSFSQTTDAGRTRVKMELADKLMNNPLRFFPAISPSLRKNLQGLPRLPRWRCRD